MLKNSSWPKRLMITLGGRPLFKKFKSASLNVKKAQEEVFKRVISENRDTVFGRDHLFQKIATFDDYRKAVPIGDFEAHRPYIDRMCDGEANVLFPGKPIIYNTTSGTTDRPKLIPVSKPYFENTYRGLSRLWFYSCLKDNPNIFDGKSLSAVSPEVDGYVSDGTPYGSISGAVYRNVPNILKSTYSTPYSIICIKDYIKKYYAMMRCALAENITYIVCPSPSNLIKFHSTVMENFEDLVRDIRNGTLRADVASEISGADREATLEYFKPNPKRAAALENLMKEHGKDLLPKHYWPNLACVNVWKQGNFSRIIPQIENYYAKRTSLRAFGYQASEARAGLVLGNDWNHSVLAANIYHFEFIEEHRKDEKDPPTILAHELEVGKQYYIIFSNGSGLYRYDINDIIKVTGLYNQFPLFKFIQKGEGVTSLTGEKLTEVQVIQAVEHVAENLSVKVEFFTMFCDEKQFQYFLYIEFAPQSPRQKKDEFVNDFDAYLRKINPEYEIKRGSKRLSPPAVKELGENSRHRLKETLVERGKTRDGQYKEAFLVKNPAMLEILESLTV